MNKICVIGVYFGHLPNYFPLWLKSAGRNEKIDFLIVTDNKLANLPSNVRVENMTLKDMKHLASRKLGFEVSLERPYKCCDFKPVYGVIFEDLIRGYEFWGHCDFDLIWGDISFFLEKYDYERYDKFLNLGHLSLYRNTDIVNAYYKENGSKCGNYIQVFTEDRGFAFDETGGIYQIYLKNRHSVFDKRIFADIAIIYHRYRLALDDINYNYQIFFWEDGHVYREYFDGDALKHDEFIYIHFKKRPNYKLSNSILNAAGFYITNNGFVEKNAQFTLTKQKVQELNHFPGAFHEWMELMSFNIRSKIQRLKRQ